MSITVTTQSELDAALASADQGIVCRGGTASAPLVVTCGQVRASGSAQVWASDSAQVEAYDSAQVEASGSAQVRRG